MVAIVRRQETGRLVMAIAASRPVAQRQPAWIAALQGAALLIWLAIPVVGVLAQSLAGRVVWTILIAALPLVIVLVGYHQWRTICPLAWISQLPFRLRRAGRGRMPLWVQRRYYYIPLMAFSATLWLRMIWINGDGAGIALFFVGLSMIAMLFGMITTGKTWCNFICPVSFIEKIYSEPAGPRQTHNSQCSRCTACKAACPDINQANAYWNEIDLPSKRVAYFMYPGLILGFYVYYFLQSGSWDYYFGGASLDEPGVIWHAFAPGYDAGTAGFFFLPGVPRAIAAFLTLPVCACLSWATFTRVLVPLVLWSRSHRLSNADTRNVMLAIAAFTGFVTFYVFAWQALLRRIDWLPPVADVLTIVIATFLLMRRLRYRAPAAQRTTKSK